MKEALPLTDEDLVRRICAGDEDAFTALYRRRQASIYRFALHMSGSPNIADEVTQEVFMLLIRQPQQFDAARGPVASFLFGVARNRVRRCLERERYYVPMADDWEENNSFAGPAAKSGSTENPFEGLAQRETIERVRMAVQALPFNYREVVVLCDLQELSYEDAARLLGCALGTVRSRLHRARALLVEKLRVYPPSANSAGTKTPVEFSPPDRPSSDSNSQKSAAAGQNALG
ncbi:MAG: RNA polymerase sigma factor [Acidipila sp.]|nr:RNA polymerase sigma factor [Acidipila sp.]